MCGLDQLSENYTNCYCCLVISIRLLPFYVCLRTNRMGEKESCSICANATRFGTFATTSLLTRWLSATTKLNSFQLSLDPIPGNAPQPFDGDDMHGEKFRESASHFWLLIKTYLSFSVCCCIAFDMVNYFGIWAECQLRTTHFGL